MVKTRKQNHKKFKFQNNYSEPETLDIATKVKYEEFIHSTVDKDTFIIQNVAEDNACFYRAISNGLFHIVNSTGNSGCEVLYSIGNWKSVIDSNITIKHKQWGYNGPEQTYLAKKIQQISRQWIVKNYKKDVVNIPSYRVIDLVRDSHDMDIPDDEVVIALYDECYTKFAGDKKIPKLPSKLSNSELDMDIDINEPESIGECMIDSDSEDINTLSGADESDLSSSVYNIPVIEQDNLYSEKTETDLYNDEEDPDYIPDITVNMEDNNTDIESEYDDIENDDFGLGGGTTKIHNMLKQEIRNSYDLSNNWDRWGSGAEAYALSQFFKVPIIVYAPKRFNFKTNRIENGRMYKTVKPDRNVRFQVLQIWGSEYQDTAPPIELLYRKMKGNIEHYMILYRL